MKFALLTAALVLTVALRAAGAGLGGGMEFAAALLEKDPVKRTGMFLSVAESDGYPADLALVYLTRSKLDPAWAPRLRLLTEKRRGELIPALLALRVSGAAARAAALEAWKAQTPRDPDDFERPLFRELARFVLTFATSSGARDAVRPELEKLILRHPDNWRDYLPQAAVLNFYYARAFRASGFELADPSWSDSPHPECRAFMQLLAEQTRFVPEDGFDAEDLVRFDLLMGERAAALGVAAEFARRHPSQAALGLLIFTAAEAGDPAVFDSLKDVVKPESMPMLKFSACLSAGDLVRAEKLLADVEPREARVPLRLKLLSAGGDFRGAAEFALAHPELPAPERALALLSAAEFLGDAKYYRAADELCNETLRRDPALANALGFVALELGMPVGPAEKLIRAALEREPENSAYLDSLAVARLRSGDIAGAWKWMTLALDAMIPHATGGEILEHAGDIKLAMGDAAEAKKFYAAALKLVRRGAEGPGGAGLRRLEKRIKAKMEAGK